VQEKLVVSKVLERGLRAERFAIVELVHVLLEILVKVEQVLADGHVCL